MNSLHKQRGINLIELMIVGFLMILIGFFMFRIMISANQSSSQSDGIAQAQETARLTMSWLRQDVRRAGLTPDLLTPRIQPFSNLCPDNISPPAANADCTFESTNPLQNDRIAVQRVFSTTSSDTRDATDCTGVNLDGTPGLESDETVLIDVYWVERNRDSISSLNSDDGDNFDDALRCVTYNEDTGQILNPAQTIASGIDGLQALYAEGAKVGTVTAKVGTVTRYVPADQIGNMADVYAIRISILARAFSDFALTQNVRSYLLLDADPYTFDDRIPRQILTTTIAPNNF